MGLRGGFALAQYGLTAELLISMGAALGLTILLPVPRYLKYLRYRVLRRFLNVIDAAAIVATYGSASAVGSITALQYLLRNSH